MPFQNIDAFTNCSVSPRFGFSSSHVVHSDDRWLDFGMKWWNHILAIVTYWSQNSGLLRLNSFKRRTWSCYLSCSRATACCSVFNKTIFLDELTLYQTPDLRRSTVLRRGKRNPDIIFFKIFYFFFCWKLWCVINVKKRVNIRNFLQLQLTSWKVNRRATHTHMHIYTCCTQQLWKESLFWRIKTIKSKSTAQCHNATHINWRMFVGVCVWVL